MLYLEEQILSKSSEPLRSEMGINMVLEKPKKPLGLQFQVTIYYPNELGSLTKAYIGEQETTYEAAKAHLDTFIANYPVSATSNRNKKNFLILIQAVE